MGNKQFEFILKIIQNWNWYLIIKTETNLE
jgi:hypothetical protein